MLCPECGYEYREGYTVCPECHCALINPTSVSPGPEPRPLEKEQWLCGAVDEFEAQLIIANLKAEGIYAFVKYRGSDSYNKILLGRTVLGVDIFVAESDYDTAKEILT